VKVGVESQTKEANRLLSLVPTDRPVSIEDLMRHTSGISYDYIGRRTDQAGLFTSPPPGRACRQQGSCRPHSRSTISPTAGNPLALRLFDRCSRTGHRNRFRKSLFQFMKQRIFDPLGMTSTKFVLESPGELARMAEPLRTMPFCLRSEKERRGHPERESGGGGLVSTNYRLCDICPDAAQRWNVRRQAIS